MVPSPFSYGRLVRVHSVDFGHPTNPYPDNGQGTGPGEWISRSPGGSTFDRGVVVDEVIAEHVVRVVFDTYRTVDDGSLALNEIRMRLYLARPSTRNPSLILMRRADHIFTMRTSNNTDANEANEAILGTSGVDFQF